MTLYFSQQVQDSPRKYNSYDARSDTSTQGQENDYCQEIPLLMSPQRGLGKAKTSLCKNFTERGYCSYGKKCQFAHGPEELRVNMEHNRSYKTKTCHAFTKKEYCRYGQRCNFIHEQQRSLPCDELWRNIYTNHRETLRGGQERVSSRLLEMLGK